MVNNYTNINKMNNYLTPQIIEHNKDHEMCRWKSTFWIETDTKMWYNKFQVYRIYFNITYLKDFMKIL